MTSIPDQPIQRIQAGVNYPYTNKATSAIERDDAQEMLSFFDWLSQDASSALTGNTAQATHVAGAEKPDALSEALKSSLLSSSEAVDDSQQVSHDDSSASVDEGSFEIEHLRHEWLQADDIQYLKQMVIPNVPIIMGTVPIQQLFPTDEATGEISYRGFDVSESLSNLVEKGVKSGKPIRVELDANASVVLKFRNGRVSAEFLANDQVSAWLVKQELEQLRQQLIAKQLPVDQLSYRQQQQPKRDKQQDQQKEGSHYQNS